MVRTLPSHHPLVVDWSVLEDTYSASDHHYITFAIAATGRRQPSSGIGGTSSLLGWSLKKLCPEALSAYWEVVGAPPPLPPNSTADAHADRLYGLLSKACDASMPRRAAVRGKTAVYWWSNEIAELRKAAIAARRRYQRAGRRSPSNSREGERDAYGKARSDLKRAIRKAQEESWKKLCLSVDNDPWGVPYRVVTKRLGRRAPALDRDTAANVARGLFPSPPPTDWDNIPLVNEELAVLADISDVTPLVPLVTTDEVERAISRLPTGKAPGPDRVPNEIIRLAFKRFPEEFVDCYNACLTGGTFPHRWKSANLVLLHKGQGRPRDLPSSFRPISLLDGAGKVFERVLLNRLEEHVSRVGAISDAQYGFRRAKSTTNAIEEVLSAARRAARGPVQDRDLCVLVTLDVKNAFNSAPWSLIDKALRRCAVPAYLTLVLRSYMCARSLVVNEDLCLPVTCGVPQGSVLGPTLWNLFYDGILRLQVREGIKLVAFADDVAVVAVAHNSELVERVVNPTLEDIADWMSSNGLQLAPEKSECVVLTNKKAYRAPNLSLQGCQVPVKKAIRYLGVRLDTRLSFVDHIGSAAAGAKKAAAALGRLMPNVGGPSQAKRSLLMSVVHSRLLYGAAVWSEPALKTQKNKNMLLQAQRCAALKVARCYRTVSDMASLVLARMPPAFLQAEDRKNAVAAKTTGAVLLKRETTARMISSWQMVWDSTSKAAWTRRLIPDLSRWWHRGPRAISFHMAQALTGHGCFQQYLWARSRAHTPACFHRPAEVDDVEHTLFICMFWNAERRELVESLKRQARPEDVMDLLCEPVVSEHPVDPQQRMRILDTARKRKVLFMKMVEDIIGRKEEWERARQRVVAEA
ncbi:unnamed protein product [Aphis gossypii]|uniref:Reverse transcriptase domain-containing protein n=1 Tax=Aphis gossypii TaxID=80765 RepID=A0A9P0NFR3_APHGO|nr:unnamed protein product [Aphis gossypii]